VELQPQVFRRYRLRLEAPPFAEGPGRPWQPPAWAGSAGWEGL